MQKHFQVQFVERMMTRLSSATQVRQKEDREKHFVPLSAQSVLLMVVLALKAQQGVPAVAVMIAVMVMRVVIETPFAGVAIHTWDRLVLTLLVQHHIEYNTYAPLYSYVLTLMSSRDGSQIVQCRFSAPSQP